MGRVSGVAGRLCRRGAPAVAVVLAIGLTLPAHAEDEPVPEPVKGTVEDVLTPSLTYPDLVPNVTEVFVFRPAVGFDPETGTFIYGPPELSFDTWSQNLGTVPLDLVSDDPTNVSNPTVSQCVSWSPDLVCRERRQVGGFELHPTHGHFHFQNFARYELRRVQRNGSVNYRPRGLLAVSDKVSFCLIDSVQVRDDARPVPTYVLCTGTREGISAGWADIYTSDLPGQQLPLEGLADGRYAVVVSMDTADSVWESDDGNNTVEVIIELSNGATEIAVVERRWP